MPRPETDMTGQWRYRRTWLGKLVLQVECDDRSHPRLSRGLRWRDAQERDLWRLRALLKRGA